jgi:arginine/ornithine N-succinyltransferase beta subunit
VLANTATEEFRATIADLQVDDGEVLVLPPDVADSLELANGDDVRVTPL